MLGTSLLKLARFSLYMGALVLIVIVLITDAVTLAAFKDIHIHGYTVEFGHIKGAGGYTMFVTVLSLIILPFLAFGNLLASRGIGLAEKLNAILHELAAVGFFVLLWFISAVVLSVYACTGGSACSKISAATAFSWLTFFALAIQAGVLTMLLMKVRKSGGDMRNTLSYQIDDDYQGDMRRQNTPGVSDQPPQVELGGASTNPYYSSNPAVNMPSAEPK